MSCDSQWRLWLTVPAALDLPKISFTRCIICLHDGMIILRNIGNIYPLSTCPYVFSLVICLFARVTFYLFSTVWCFRPYKPYYILRALSSSDDNDQDDVQKDKYKDNGIQNDKQRQIQNDMQIQIKKYFKDSMYAIFSESTSRITYPKNFPPV